MNCWHYLLGLIYYILMPFSVLVEAPKFIPNDRKIQATITKITQRYNNGYTFPLSGYVPAQSYAFMTSVQMFGLFLFLWSSYMQHQCFLILAAARRNNLGFTFSFYTSKLHSQLSHSNRAPALFQVTSSVMNMPSYTEDGSTLYHVHISCSKY
ncbi:conserved hypothetical protein [Trichinella spiralis]|uniref:hypothetical protein n=1 Tax=Trichinella spiralis TaxID=6334 RepID=UPI0001EFCF60|nr:conserved hypothetical protein [Trichinella spiralis]